MNQAPLRSGPRPQPTLNEMPNHMATKAANDERGRKLRPTWYKAITLKKYEGYAETKNLIELKP